LIAAKSRRPPARNQKATPPGRCPRGHPARPCRAPRWPGTIRVWVPGPAGCRGCLGWRTDRRRGAAGGGVGGRAGLLHPRGHRQRSRQAV